jgi:hypothetical protein
VVERIAVDKLSSQRLSRLLAAALKPDVRATLEGLKTEALRAEAATERLAKIEARLKELETDGARLRDDLAAAGKGGAPRVAEELGARLLKLEEELTKLRAEKEEATKAVHAAREAALSKVVARS